MNIDKVTKNILKEIKESNVFDFNKAKSESDVSVLIDVHDELLDLRKSLIRNISKNEKTSTIVFLMNSLINEIRSYVDKQENI